MHNVTDASSVNLTAMVSWLQEEVREFLVELDDYRDPSRCKLDTTPSLLDESLDVLGCCFYIMEELSKHSSRIPIQEREAALTNWALKQERRGRNVPESILAFLARAFNVLQPECPRQRDATLN